MKTATAKALLLLSLLAAYHSIRAEIVCADISQHDEIDDSDMDNDDALETDARKKKKVKKFCNVCAQCLSVSDNLTVGGTLTANGPLVANNSATITGPVTLDGSSFPFTPSYGYVYDTAIDLFLPGSPITFNNNGPLFGITHTLGTSQITIQNTGVYMVLWSAAVGSYMDTVCEIYINGVPAPSTAYLGFLAAVGLAILSLSAGDVIELVTISGIYGPPIEASVLIRQIG